MSEDLDLKAFIAARDEILCRPFDDAGFQYWAKQWGVPISPRREVREIAFHKARTAVTALSRALRDESIEWLRERGYQDWS